MPFQSTRIETPCGLSTRAKAPPASSAREEETQAAGLVQASVLQLRFLGSGIDAPIRKIPCA
jgi:hypothetical protein